MSEIDTLSRLFYPSVPGRTPIKRRGRHSRHTNGSDALHLHELSEHVHEHREPLVVG